MGSMTSYEYPRIADQAKTYYMRLAQDATLAGPAARAFPGGIESGDSQVLSPRRV